jgi:hypothetical protein
LKLFCILLSFFLTSVVWAQSPVSADRDSTTFDSLNINYVNDEEIPDYAGPADTVIVAHKKFSKTTVGSLKADEELQYTQPPTIAESIWQRIKRWISWFFSSLFEKTTTTDLGRFLLFSLAVVAIIIIVMTLLRVNAFRVFYSGADSASPAYSVFHENIHEMNFEKLIQEATDKKDFRLATRLVFLCALKLLADKQLIAFMPGKTNHDYVEELNPSEIKTGLNELSFYFDYAWYGNFVISESHFQRITQTFSLWKEKVQ